MRQGKEKAAEDGGLFAVLSKDLQREVVLHLETRIARRIEVFRQLLVGVFRTAVEVLVLLEKEQRLVVVEQVEDRQLHGQALRPRRLVRHVRAERSSPRRASLAAFRRDLLMEYDAIGARNATLAAIGSE